MGRFHISPTEESMNLRAQYAKDPDNFVPPQPAVEIKTQVVEVPVIVEKEVIKEIKVPEYITVIKEVKVEVPVMMEVEKIVEKIIEIPKIQIVEKPITVTREIYDVKNVIREKQAHDRTKKRLHLAYTILAFSLLINFLMVVK